MDPAIERTRAHIDEKTAGGEIDRNRRGWRTSLPIFPDLELAGDTEYFWDITTNHGDVRVRLLADSAPRHVANFIYLTELGYFDGLLFHRVIPGFMAQGGCPEGKGFGGPGYKFSGEFGSRRHDRAGLLSMANAGPDTDGSQFFLTFVHTPWLDDKHTLFGEVVAGMETLGELEKRGSQAGRTSEKLIIESARITVGE